MPIDALEPRLLRAEDSYGDNPVDFVINSMPPAFIDREAPDQSLRGTDSDTTTMAFVAQGRWVASCPFCGPNHAQLVTPNNPRYLCGGWDGCANGDVQGAYVQVVFPAESAEIEAVLLARPRRENRNWFPNETVVDLVAENEAHGI